MLAQGAEWSVKLYGVLYQDKKDSTIVEIVL